MNRLFFLLIAIFLITNANGQIKLRKRYYVQNDIGWISSWYHTDPSYNYCFSISKEIGNRFKLKSEMLNFTNSKNYLNKMIFYEHHLIALESIKDFRLYIGWQLFENKYFDLVFNLGGFIGKSKRIYHQSTFIQPDENLYMLGWYPDKAFRAGLSSNVELKIYIKEQYYTVLSGTYSEPIVGLRAIQSLNIGFGMRFN